MFTFTRRGYIGTGVWSPHFLLEYPEVLREVYYDFVRAGTDVIQALQVNLERERERERENCSSFVVLCTSGEAEASVYGG